MATKSTDFKVLGIIDISAGIPTDLETNKDILRRCASDENIVVTLADSAGNPADILLVGVTMDGLHKLIGVLDATKGNGQNIEIDGTQYDICTTLTPNMSIASADYKVDPADTTNFANDFSQMRFDSVGYHYFYFAKGGAAATTKGLLRGY